MLLEIRYLVLSVFFFELAAGKVTKNEAFKEQPLMLKQKIRKQD
jgi:hypothetical protein